MQSLGELLKKYRAGESLPQPVVATSSAADRAEGPGQPGSCPQCGGLGWLRRELPVDDPEFGRIVPCQCRQERFESERFGRLLRFSNLGVLATVTFESLSAPAGSSKAAPGRFQQARETAMAFAEKPQGWLVIAGPGGSGKTRLAAAIANRCVQRGEAVLFIGVADLLDHLRSTYAPSSEIAYDELFDRVRNVPVLVLDDLGAQSSTPWAQEKLSQLLGHRYNARAPTVITTASAMEELGEGLRSRLADRTLAQTIALGGPASSGDVLGSLDLKELPELTFESFHPGGLDLKGPMRENLVEAWNLARRFAENPEGWLVLIGGHGCGKTHLAIAIARECRNRGDDVPFILAPKLLDYLRSTFQSESVSAYQVLERLERAGLLVMDDFSEANPTPYSREKLYQVLNYRALMRLPTVITSAIPPEEMEPRLRSRLEDPRLSNVYEILAPDYHTGRIRPPARTSVEAARGRPRGRGPAA